MSVSFACKFVQEYSVDTKKPVTFSQTGGDHVLHQLLHQPGVTAEIRYRVGCNRVTCFIPDRGNWRNSAHLD